MLSCPRFFLTIGAARRRIFNFRGDVDRSLYFFKSWWCQYCRPILTRALSTAGSHNLYHRGSPLSPFVFLLACVRVCLFVSFFSIPGGGVVRKSCVIQHSNGGHVVSVSRVTLGIILAIVQRPVHFFYRAVRELRQASPRHSFGLFF